MDYLGPDGGGDVGKHLVDVLSIGTILGALAGWLPAIAAGLSIIWTAIRIYETKTVRGWLGKGGDNAAD